MASQSKNFLYGSIIFIILSIIIVNYFSKSSQKNTITYDPEEIEHSKYTTLKNTDTKTLLAYNLVPGILTTSNELPIAGVPLKKFKSHIKEQKDKIVSLPISLKYKNALLTKNITQGLCGSCWVFAVLAVLADKVCMYSKGKRSQGLSVQQILSCYPNKQGCEGDSPDDLALWLEKTELKVKNRSEMPYKQLIDLSVYTDCPFSVAGIQIQKNSVRSIVEYVEEETSSYKHTSKDRKIIEKNVFSMKKELFTTGPFYAVISIKKEFYEYSGNDVYESDINSENIGGHAIEVIGYNSVNRNMSYWICRNFWTDWPINTKNGIFKIKMGINSGGIESRCGTLEPVLSIPRVIDKTVFDQ